MNPSTVILVLGSAVFWRKPSNSKAVRPVPFLSPVNGRLSVRFLSTATVDGGHLKLTAPLASYPEASLGVIKAEAYAEFFLVEGNSFETIERLMDPGETSGRSLRKARSTRTR